MDLGRLDPILSDLKRRLKDPLQLRFAVGLGMAGTWYLAAYLPMSEGIEAAGKDRAAAIAHAGLAREVRNLRAAAEAFRGRLPARVDANEWVEFLMAAIRERPVKLLKLEPQASKAQGPFQVVVVKAELSGKFADLDRLLAWLEANPRLVRVDAVTIEPARGLEHGLTMKLTLLGVMG